MRHIPRSRGRAAAVALLAALVAGALAVPATSSPAATHQLPVAPERASLVRIVVPDVAALERLVATGTDLAEYHRWTAGGIEVHAVVTPSQLGDLRARGFRAAGTVAGPRDVARRRAERQATIDTERRAQRGTDQVTVERAVWFRTSGQVFLSLEATTTAGEAPKVLLTATWRGRGGARGSATLERREDVGVYMGHELLVPVPTPVTKVSILSSQGGRDSAKAREWLRGPPVPPDPHHLEDFVTHYMDPTEVYQRIESLAREFPDLAEIVELPLRTNGYRRHAQAVLGTRVENAVVITSRAWGHEGGNDLSVETVAGAPGEPLAVTVDGGRVTVRLATGAGGQPSSTAADVVAALNAGAGELLTASTFRGDAGAGVVAPEGPLALSDFLDAPERISREPFTVRAIRIGRHRDGSRLGVLAYAQEHAREWVTPLVAVETAERLLRNYAHDRATRKLVDGLDIFIVPSVNPDGGHFSFYDANFQRKTMTNYCGPERSDPFLRRFWGVDVNRNHTAGSRFDGYFGASGNCLSGTFAGPGELSEPESGNLIWLAERFDNIRFAMNVHSYGGYFMWPPGSYRLEGRESLPRPTEEELDFFLASAKRIERAIASERGTVTWPVRTGPVVDVLYSAAGNSADALWYEHGIFGWDFEVGNNVWDAEEGDWDAVGFQPPFQPEGHDEAMEYASGLIELLEVARDFSRR